MDRFGCAVLSPAADCARSRTEERIKQDDRGVDAEVETRMRLRRGKVLLDRIPDQCRGRGAV